MILVAVPNFNWSEKASEVLHWQSGGYSMNITNYIYGTYKQCRSKTSRPYLAYKTGRNPSLILELMYLVVPNNQMLIDDIPKLRTVILIRYDSIPFSHKIGRIWWDRTLGSHFPGSQTGGFRLHLSPLPGRNVHRVGAVHFLSDIAAGGELEWMEAINLSQKM